MRHSEIMILLCGILPIRVWKAALLRGHIEKCPECGRRLATKDEVRRLLVRAGDLDDLSGLWPAISERIRGLRPAPTSFARGALAARAHDDGGSWRSLWRWAVAATGLFAAAFSILWLVRLFQTAPVRPGNETAAARLEEVKIGYVRIDNEPARTFIFKPHDSDVVIVWAGKNI